MTGKPRRTPLVYRRDGDDLIVLPAAAGSTAREATVTLGGEQRRVTADDAEHDRLWAEYINVYPHAREYGAFTDGELRPVRLLRRDPGRA